MLHMMVDVGNGPPQDIHEDVGDDVLGDLLWRPAVPATLGTVERELRGETAGR